MISYACWQLHCVVTPIIFIFSTWRRVALLYTTVLLLSYWLSLISPRLFNILPLMFRTSRRHNIYYILFVTCHVNLSNIVVNLPWFKLNFEWIVIHRSRIALARAPSRCARWGTGWYESVNECKCKCLSRARGPSHVFILLLLYPVRDWCRAHRACKTNYFLNKILNLSLSLKSNIWK